MKFKIIILLLLTIILNSCERKTSYDDVISKYNDTDFLLLKNRFIAIRGASIFNTTYIINDSSDNWPYFVEYNNITNSISKKWTYGNNHIDFTEKEIKKMINKLKKLNLFLISVDNDSNVFINPYRINSPPLFLRVNKYTGIDTIKKGFIFTHYKDNWYVNK